jgi:poly-gamma-glutamate synthesis protein (capsule biosynthesis protein)
MRIGRRRFMAGTVASAAGLSGTAKTRHATTLFLCGDVMLGRGVDQILPHPGNATLHEGYAKSALDYVSLAERRNGPVPRHAGFAYIWGDALATLERASPAARIVNLETAVTTSSSYEPKGINYRLHPANASALLAAKLDCCVLANNHVLDWGEAGLRETLTTLARLGVRVAGAGLDAGQAAAPAAIPVGERRVLVFGLGLPTSGVSRAWAATDSRPGVNVLSHLSERSVVAVARMRGRVGKATSSSCRSIGAAIGATKSRARRDGSRMRSSSAASATSCMAIPRIIRVRWRSIVTG